MAYAKLITIGCDPEVFVRNTTTNAFESAHGLLPGNKQTPFVVPDGAIQIDGMACEFNTDPVTTRAEFVRKVTSVFASMSARLPMTVEPAIGVPVAHFTAEVYDAQPEEALELGCEPDYNAYTEDANPRPDVSTGTMRTAAGHIHIGFTDGMIEDAFSESHMNDCYSLTKFLDATVGVASLKYDTDVERRSLYGAAGAFRPKVYGLEYRVLSNAWLRNEELIGNAFDSVVNATKAWTQGKRLLPFMYDAAQAIINTSDFDSVDSYMEEVARQIG